MPMVRISQGKYLIGSELKQLELKRQAVMVRIGGGYE
jgi:hypothetical protein